MVLGRGQPLLEGLLIYEEERAGDDSALAFLQAFSQQKADFARCTGSYRIRITYPDRREVYWGDNAGIPLIYFDP